MYDYLFQCDFSCFCCIWNSLLINCISKLWLRLSACTILCFCFLVPCFSCNHATLVHEIMFNSGLLSSLATISEISILHRINIWSLLSFRLHLIIMCALFPQTPHDPMDDIIFHYFSHLEWIFLMSIWHLHLCFFCLWAPISFFLTTAWFMPIHYPSCCDTQIYFGWYLYS